jgi:hypothetical protein
VRHLTRDQLAVTSWPPGSHLADVRTVHAPDVHRSPANPIADEVRTYLELTRLLDDLERTHPEVSAPLRLTLVRAHREHQVAWLDEIRFRSVVAELTAHARPAQHAGMAS